MVGKLVSLMGQVTVRRSAGSQWEPAQVGQSLWAGDAVRTGPASRAAILCQDESQVKLNENTILVLKSVTPSPRLGAAKPLPAAAGAPAPSIYQILQGEIWLRNKNEKFRFELETPAVTANIRGTEFNVKVKPDGTTHVTLLEGSLCLVSPQGELCLRPGEEGYAVPGQAPSKRVLVQPADAVQWAIYYPGVISYRDLALLSLPGEQRIPPGPSWAAALVQQGETFYSQGQLEEAGRAAAEVLGRDPGNGRALNLMGWLCLQRGAPEEAQGYFLKIRQLDDRAVIGLALARYRLGNLPGAYELLQTALGKIGPTPLLRTMAGYFALMVGRVEEAREDLEAAIRMQPQAAALPRSFLAQIYLAQNRKDAAATEANRAVAEAPGSPMALFTLGLVQLARFDLAAASQSLEKSLAADPRFVSAYVYLAKIWLGSEYLGRARKTIDRALNLAPRDPQVLSLAGFIRLAHRDYSGAMQLWTRAALSDPGFGEPHLGLAIYYFRYREFHRGLEEMLTATLLDPRVSLYQSELGKALFQTRAFDKALEVLDYAKTLDPKDPTPHFYRGVALSDLNRPGEAIQEINRSIELNDNVAMFRSRSLLDQDRAVRNYSLARAYQQLGLGEWAFSKAVTAVKHDPYNSSAHLFLRDSFFATGPAFLNTGQLFSAREIEGVLYRLLSPANQNTFSNLTLEGTENLGLTFDYTSMFEMPYARAVAEGGIGTWEAKKSIQDHQGLIYGGLPGAAFFVGGRYFDSRGQQKTPDTDSNVFGGTDRAYNVETSIKWAPTVQGTLSGLFQYSEEQQSNRLGQSLVSGGTPVALTQFDKFSNRFRFYELGYYYRFNPQAGFLAYLSHREFPFHVTSNALYNANLDIFGIGVPLPVSQQNVIGQTFDRETNDIQFQKHLILGQHNLIAGFDYFWSNISQRISQNILESVDLSMFGQPPLTGQSQTNFDFRPPFRSYSFYLLDYWRLHKNLVLELGLFKDFSKDVRLNFPGNIYTSLWSPRFGANYQFGLGDTRHTLRLVAERHLTTHLATQPLLVPSEIAGFPWAITADSGSEVRQAGAGWEAQWGPKTFTSLRLDALRVATPDFVVNPADSTQDLRVWHNWQRYQASLVLNRILTPSLGLSLGVLGKRVVPDLSYQTDFPFILQDYSEVDAFVGLSYLNRQGWLARIKPLLVQQYLKNPGHKASAPFVVMNLSLGREFPNKRGLALFEIQNLFNRQPFYSLEPARIAEFATERRFLFRLAFYF